MKTYIVANAVTLC